MQFFVVFQDNALVSVGVPHLGSDGARLSLVIRQSYQNLRPDFTVNENGYSVER